MSLRISIGLLAVAVGAACADYAEAPTEPATAIVPVFAHGQGQGHQVATFRTHATGAEEVPPRDTDAQGQAVFRLSRDGTTLHYQLVVANIENVTQAHIHMAPPGENGGIVAWLYPSGPPDVLIEDRVQGVLGQGEITDADVIGDLAGDGVAGLLEAILAGNTYVNVHTSQFPGGEIRGQID
jgi:hypothetical protein